MKFIGKNKLFAILILLSILLSGCVGNSADYTSTNQSTGTIEKSAVEKENQEKIKILEEDNLSNDNYYINSSGNKVHSPAHAPSKPAGASAKCKDGTYSFSQSRRGTCSHHGGVAIWY